MMELLILVVFPLAMFFAAASDLLTMTIPNKVSLILIFGFVILSWFIGMDIQAFAWHWALAGIVLVCGFGFFAAGWMGGGDVKLAAATSLWLGWEFTLPYLAIAGFMGGILTILIMIARSKELPLSLYKIKWISRLHAKNEGVPYGIALGPAAVLVYQDTPWMQYVFNSVGS